ncbi:hypothetical protein [Haloarcula japonica]|uniref:Lipoprotein n=1 Tax=Haloarcula japonica (strain ATCC 49778 / DSM 6131 / JCM 7785 / NBRC 101032 / NCIMB 13157 / TR-1) TaxID=1227453 RepID=M0L9E3_HALJT|nr:hypothetical protein [Haloarcula japonica]EMA29713.1 hypothetical protein C444_12977 [Haloarcula japonica DSM 6131]
MALERRTVLAVLTGVLTAGCSAPSGDGEPPTQPGEAPQCDPADVSRPPVATGTNIQGRAYPQKPETLTTDSILLYLDDFETAFAWNRVLQTAETVTSVGVNNLEGFWPDETGDGYLASSGIRVSYSTADGDRSEREYVANYFVSPGPVYRYESSNEPVTPETDAEETLLVQCGADS